MSDPSTGGTPADGRGDNEAEMRPTRFLTDDAIEALVHDRPVEPAYAHLVSFAQRVRAVGEGPAPRPSAELAALLDGTTAPHLGNAHNGHHVRSSTATVVNQPDLVAGVAGRRNRLAGRIAGLGLAGKVALGTALAAAGVAGAGAAGVLPAGATATVRHAIEAVSPVDFPPDAADPGDGPRSGNDTSSTSSTDTTGETGDEPAVADDANGADHRPDHSAVDEPPGQSGETGLTRANETPAAPHAPDTTPGPPGDAGSGSSPGSAPSTVPAHGGQADDHIPDS